MTFICPKCGHILEVFLEGIEAFCWHDGTKWQGKTASLMEPQVVAK